MKTTKFIKSNFLAITSLCLALTVLSCKSDDDGSHEEEAVCLEHFSYDDEAEDGPFNWDNYCVAEGTTNACGSIVRQSPINLANAVDDATLSYLSMDYGTSTTDIVNNGHTIQFNYNGPSSDLIFAGETYDLLQFHFHADSEHTVAGAHHPLEVHLVHKSASGALAVIGVFFEAGAENELLAQFSGHLPEHANETYTDATLNYNAEDFVNTSSGYYNYSGSLTTPPCSEIVEWIVMEQPLEASQAQLNTFSSLLHGNYRPVQPLNGRTIKHRPAQG